MAENCYFEGGKDCLRIRGAGTALVRMSNCALWHYERPFLVAESAQVSFRLRNISILAENGPVFDLQSLTGLSFEVDNSIFSRREEGAAAPLINVEAPIENLSELEVWW